MRGKEKRMRGKREERTCPIHSSHSSILAAVSSNPPPTALCVPQCVFKKDTKPGSVLEEVNSTGVLVDDPAGKNLMVGYESTPYLCAIPCHYRISLGFEREKFGIGREKKSKEERD